MRRHLVLLLVLALTASLAPSGAAAAGPPDGQVNAAKYNKKKCKKAKTKKAKKKYCKKKKRKRGDSRGGTSTPAPAPAPPAPAPPAPAPGATTPGTTTPGTTTPGNQLVRDDAGFTSALAGSRLHKASQGNVGYGEYTWNFCAGGQWSYRSYYYAGSTVESNDGGSWQVSEGYRAASDPTYLGGLVVLTTSEGHQHRFGVEVRGAESYVKTNLSSFEEGAFSRMVGGAAC